MNLSTGTTDDGLDPDVERWLAAVQHSLPDPWHLLGVPRSRIAVRGLRPQQVDPVASVIDTSFPGRHGSVPVRIYRTSDKVRPVIVYLHGGGWMMGTLDGVDACCRRLANLSNCAVVSVDYRLAPEHPYPAPLDDCFDALAHIADRGVELGLDGSRIAVCGDSAGGNLAIALCLRARDLGGPEIRAQAVAYPVIDVTGRYPSDEEYSSGPVVTAADLDWFAELYLPIGSDRSDPGASPANAPSFAGLPAALVVSARHDPLRDQAYEYARRLRTDAVPVEESRHDGAVHGFFTEVGTLAAADAAAVQVARFLGEQLSRPVEPANRKVPRGLRKEQQ